MRNAALVDKTAAVLKMPQALLVPQPLKDLLIEFVNTIDQLQKQIDQLKEPK